MRTARLTPASVLAAALLAMFLFISACGGQEPTTSSDPIPTIQTTTTAAPNPTTPAAAVDAYRSGMKALWDEYGTVLDTLDDALDVANPLNLTEAELLGVQSLLETLDGFVGGLRAIAPPADLAEAHTTYQDVLARLAVGLSEFASAAAEQDTTGMAAGMTAVYAFFEQESAAMTQAAARLEQALGFSLVGAASGPATTTSVAPSLGSDAQTYTDSTHGYSFSYPAAWQLDDSAIIDATAGSDASSRVGAFDPNGRRANGIYIDLMAVSTYPLAVTLTDADIPALQGEIEALLAGLESQAMDVQVISPLAPVELKGVRGFVVGYTFDKDGVPTTTEMYFLFSGNMEYQVTLQAATENWEKNRETFAAMLASFTAP